MNLCTSCSRTFEHPAVESNDGAPTEVCPFCHSERFSVRDYQERLTGMQVYDPNEDGAD